MRRRLIGLFVVLAIAWGGVALLTSRGITPQLGLDLQGGASVVLTAPAGTDPDVLSKAVELMRTRIEEIGGVQEPEIQISGANTVLVQLPGVKDEQRALNAVGRTGQLSFRPVLDVTPGSVGPLGSDYVNPADATTTTTPGSSTVPTTAPTTTEPVTTTTTTTIPADLAGNLDPKTGLTVNDDPTTEAYILDTSGIVPLVYHLGPAALLGTDVTSATAGYDPNSAQWLVSLDLNSDGADKFANITGEAARYPTGDPRREIAIVLDGEIISSPQVNESVAAGVGITGGRAQITVGTGDQSRQDAQDLGVVLKYGSLPVNFERSQVNKVSATLGADSLRIGLIAGLAGLVLVAMVLLLFYRSMGIIAIVGLTVFGSLLISVFSVLGRTQGLTLTLAGVTGIIVSVGITADSYIVYFERIKDEIRSGKRVSSAVTDGFKAAFRTILTADTVSILGSVLLYFLAVGPVKGFALSLGIATTLDIIVARTFTRRAAWVLGHSPLAEGGRFSIEAVVEYGKVAEETTKAEEETV